MIEFMFSEMRSILIIIATIVVVEAGLFKKKAKKGSECEDPEEWQEFCKNAPVAYCTSRFTSTQEKLERCPKSCGLCCVDGDNKCKTNMIKALAP
ncbi:hypothetical protein GCK32_001139 [Trichostrongylus colubriformis]|uniref:ShKT domain-containing protein n=1 Tax=Trichostrongylus colubriformis TaxID=6319 RepID=A0AAN8J345_TRICO